MKTYKTLGLIGLAAASLFVGQAFAAVCPIAPVGGGTTQGGPTCIATTSPDGVGDDLNSMFGPGGSLVTSGPGVNVYNGQYTPSSQWQIGSTGGSVNTIVLEIAGNANINSFGIYDPSNTSNTLQLFGGPDGAGKMTTLAYLGGGQFAAQVMGGGYTTASFGTGASFGYYLNTGNEIFYSNSFLNQDAGSSYANGTPHMVAYEGGNGTYLDVNGNSARFLANEFLLAWEDQPFANSDLDYNDFVVLVESVHSVPEPAALGMFGLGALMIGLAVGLRRRREDV